MKVALVRLAMILASVVLPTPGGAPEDEAGGVVVFDLQAERFAGGEEMGLAEELVEGARAHALGEGRALLRGLVAGVEIGGEEAHKSRQ